MLTLFSTCKPFRGMDAVRQRNAISSWAALGPDAEVILLGDEDGVAEIAAELNLRHIKDVERTELGTPLVSSLFQKAQEAARYPFVCYVNADIILMPDFLEAARRLAVSHFPRFLLVGRRNEVELAEPLDFSKPDWQEYLTQRLFANSYLYSPSGIDYFVFPKGLWTAMPRLIIGRPAWDHWVIHDALTRNIPIVDGTDAITAVHQSHDWNYRPGSTGGSRSGPEVLANLAIAGDFEGFDIQDATWVLTREGLTQVRSLTRARRHAYYLGVHHPWLRTPMALLGRGLQKLGLFGTPQSKVHQ